MASVLRTGLANLNPTGLVIGLCKGTSKCRNVAVTQVACISSRQMRQDRPPRPPPFDWRHKNYNFWHYLTDPMEERFDDNTKIISVEGMPGVGKAKFAKQLAEELEMQYVEPPNFDMVWVNPYGFDERSLNHKLPIDAQAFDIQSFLEDPTGSNSAAMQTVMLYLRSWRYIDTLVDVLSSGQGAVVQRCPWTDVVFMQAMQRSNYVSKMAYEYYKAAITTILPELLRPHLIVYLDAPIPVIKDNIKKRNIPYEVNSKALSDTYLQHLETLYKDQYLREMMKHGHLLIYDWAKEGDIGVVVEDIERLDFDTVDDKSEKFHDWKYDHIDDLKELRAEFQQDKTKILLGINVCRFDIPEMLRDAASCRALEAAMLEVQETHYTPGFNPKYDKGYLWKLNDTWEDWLPRKGVKKQQ